MTSIVEHCIIDRELTPALIQYKHELDQKMDAELDAIEAGRGRMWASEERQYAEVRHKYAVAWETALIDAGYFLRPTFESVQAEFGDWYDHLTSLNESTYTKPISVQDAQNLIKSYAREIDFKLAKEYTQVFGIQPEEGVSLVECRQVSRTSVFEPPQRLYDIHFKGWDRYYPRVELSRLFNKAAMMKLLIDGFTRSMQHFKGQEITKALKAIDVFAVGVPATVVALGKSGTLYELRSDSLGKIGISVNNGSLGPATLLREPFEIIYTRVYKDDGNRYTYRDSYSTIYYSWNSKYAKQLDGYLPSTFGRTDGYMGSYSETIQISEPTLKTYSRADQIDSWAKTETVRVATD